MSKSGLQPLLAKLEGYIVSRKYCTQILGEGLTFGLLLFTLH
jgi:hypothetical protein